jgi:hypothetical protein
MITLDVQESMCIRPTRRMRISCLSGRVWLTCEGDVRDSFLGHGDCAEVESGLTMLTAIEPAVLSIVKCEKHTWLQRIAAALLGALRALRSPAGRTVYRA